LSFNIAAFSLLLAWIARGQIGVSVGFALAGIAGWFLSRSMGMRPLHRLDGEVRETSSAAGARTLLASLRERKSVEWFAPANFTPLMEGRLQLRIGDFRAAAAAYARAGQASVAPEAARSMHAAQAHALVMAGDHKEALAQLSELGDLKDFDPQVRLDLAIAKLSIPGSTKGVVDELEALEGGLAAHPRALAAKSVALHREGDTDGAIACFERLAAQETRADPVLHALVKRARKSLRGELKAREKAARQQQVHADQSTEGGASASEGPVTSPAAPAASRPSKRRKGKGSKSDKRVKKEARRRERQEAKAKAKAAKHAARQAALSERAVTSSTASTAPKAAVRVGGTTPPSVTPKAAPSVTPKAAPSVASKLPSLPSLKKLSDQRGATPSASTAPAPKPEAKSGSQILAGLPPLRAAKLPSAAAAPTPTVTPAPSPSPSAEKPSLAAALSNPLGSKGEGTPVPAKVRAPVSRPVSAILEKEKIAPATLPAVSPASPQRVAPLAAPKPPLKATRSLPDLPPIPTLPSVPAVPSPSAPKPASPASTPSWASLLDDLPSAPAPSAPAPSAPAPSAPAPSAPAPSAPEKSED
jgi:tetratricopeptide (TPR) repeat protein